MRSALLDLEGTEADQRNLLAGSESLGDALQHGRDNLVGVLAGQAALWATAVISSALFMKLAS